MRNFQKGSVLVLAMFVLVLILLLAGLFLQLTVQSLLMLERIIERERMYWIAKAGLSRMTYELKRYYFTNQQTLIEEEFGKGKYKVGVLHL